MNMSTCAFQDAVTDFGKLVRYKSASSWETVVIVKNPRMFFVMHILLFCASTACTKWWHCDGAKRKLISITVDLTMQKQWANEDIPFVLSGRVIKDNYQM